MDTFNSQGHRYLVHTRVDEWGDFRELTFTLLDNIESFDESTFKQYGPSLLCFLPFPILWDYHVQPRARNFCPTKRDVLCFKDRVNASSSLDTHDLSKYRQKLYNWLVKQLGVQESSRPESIPTRLFNGAKRLLKYFAYIQLFLAIVSFALAAGSILMYGGSNVTTINFVLKQITQISKSTIHTTRYVPQQQPKLTTLSLCVSTLLLLNLIVVVVLLWTYHNSLKSKRKHSTATTNSPPPLSE